MLLALVVVKEHRIRSLMLLLAAAAVAVSPWVARNYAVAGSPSLTLYNSRALLAKTDSFHRIDLELHAPAEIGEVMRVAGDEIVAKIGRNVWPNLVDPGFWWQILGIYAICFPVFALGLLTRRKQPSLYRWFEVSVVVFCLANFFMVCTTYHRPRYYETLIPFIIVLMSRRTWWLIEMILPWRGPRAKRWAAVVVGSIFLLGGYRVFTTFRDHARYAASQPHADPSFPELAEITGPEDVIASDLSLEITVHNGNRTVRLPAEPDDLLEIDREYLALDCLVISEHVARRHPYEGFLESERFQQNFRQTERLSNGARVFCKRQGYST